MRLTLEYDGLPTIADCNNNGLLDSCEIGNGSQQDCNANGKPDSCDIAAGTSLDCNANGKPDSCELARGDLNLDGSINAADITILLNFWGVVNPPTGDLTGDRLINAADITVILSNWGTQG